MTTKSLRFALDAAASRSEAVAASENGSAVVKLESLTKGLERHD